MNIEKNIFVEEIKIGEYFRLKDILKQQQLFHYNLNGPFKESFLEINEKNFEEYMKKKYKSITLAAVLDNNIIGFTSANINRHNEAFIEDLFVSENYRNNSIGSKLFQRILKWLEDNEAKTVEVHISVGNENVRDFYDKFGFKMTGYTMKKSNMEFSSKRIL